MSILNEAKSASDGPLICTIAGDPGLGKTSLACAFPNPIVLCAEKGLQRAHKDVKGVKGIDIDSTDRLKQVLNALLRDEHDYKTLVIDSVSALEAMFIDEIVADDPNARSINTAMGGYGNGPSAVAHRHEAVRKWSDKIRQERNMHVVFIAHADTEAVNMLDREEAYMRYSFRLAKKSLRPYVDESDLIGFVRLDLFLKGEGKGAKRAVAAGNRLFDCSPNAWSIAKNGLGITEPMEFPEGTNPLAPYLIES